MKAAKPLVTARNTVAVLAAAAVLSACGNAMVDPVALPVQTDAVVPGPPNHGALAPDSETPLPTTTVQPVPARPAESAPRPAPRPRSTLTGWPGPDNTGWRHTGVELTEQPCNREFVVDTDGAVIDGKRIKCPVRVNANDVTIKRSEVHSSGSWAIYKPDEFRNLTVVDTEVVGSPGCELGIGFNFTTVLRADVHGCADGVRTERGSTLQDSWIHDLWRGDGAHNDGVQSTGSSDITIRHNRIENPQNQTSCILIGGEFGSPSNVLIEDNYLDGGNFTIYLDPVGSNRVIRNNTFTRSHVYGPARVDGQREWVGNVYTDGAPVDDR